MVAEFAVVPVDVHVRLIHDLSAHSPETVASMAVIFGSGITGAGGAGKVVEFAAREGRLSLFPKDAGLKEWTFFFAAAITMAPSRPRP